MVQRELSLDKERNEKPNRKLVLSITPTLEELLEKKAHKDDRSKSHIVRKSLRRYFRWLERRGGKT